MPDFDLLVVDPAHDLSPHAIVSYRKGDVESGWTELEGDAAAVADLVADIATANEVTRIQVNIVGDGAVIAADLAARDFEVIEG